MGCCGIVEMRDDLVVTLAMAADLVTLDGISRAIYKLDGSYYFDQTEIVIERGYTIIQVLQ